MPENLGMLLGSDTLEFNPMIESSTFKFCVAMMVSVPCTVKLPDTVMLPPTSKLLVTVVVQWP
jgi:hypothetical protein